MGEEVRRVLHEGIKPRVGRQREQPGRRRFPLVRDPCTRNDV
jgi:hypothetical protein